MSLKGSVGYDWLPGFSEICSFLGCVLPAHSTVLAAVTCLLTVNYQVYRTDDDTQRSGATD